MLYVLSIKEFNNICDEIIKINNIDSSKFNYSEDAYLKIFVYNFLNSYLLMRHSLNNAKILFKTLCNKKNLIVKDYYGNIVNLDKHHNINKYLFSVFKFEQTNINYIIEIDEWMLFNFYNSACHFCKIHSNMIYEEDPYKNLNDNFDALIREDRNELVLNDFKKFIPDDPDNIINNVLNNMIYYDKEFYISKFDDDDEEDNENKEYEEYEE